MRFTVTALGSAGDRPVGVVVGAIARYLVAPDLSPETPGGPSSGGWEGEGSVARYYADRGHSPGRWLGQGTCELGLAGRGGLRRLGDPSGSAGRYGAPEPPG